ncbi:translation elongation factor tu [Stylonychia lemnae]|uniref:Elongation factor Tu, apicoplast n=1 Tax=Stylonychia lemnae TaxID=5949 RepID=A0A078B9Q0_STYLE|nr:translation elongation factor tu [Stylonychia lemnae]|eukprot:CDW89977.1 translation elongation factor tu [Stylonychia lemnae]
MEQSSARTKPHLNVGTIGKITSNHSAHIYINNKIGHLGDGSTQFKDIQDIDKTKEEKAKGISINATRIEYESESRHYAHVDCPGHDHYLKNMFTGASGMDCAILVVSAADGVRAQTREHVLLSRQAGVDKIVVFINKLDGTDPDMAELIELNIRELLTSYKYDGDNAPVIRGSALSALNGSDPELGEKAIERLLEVLDNNIQIPDRDLDKPFLMSISRSYNIPGRGTVVTGTIKRGRCQVNDQLEVTGLNRTNHQTTVLSIESFNKLLDFGQAGDYVGILLSDVTKEQVRRGKSLSQPGSVGVRRNFEAEMYVLRSDEGGRKTGFVTGYRPQAYLATSDVEVRFELREGVENVLPGDNVSCKLKLRFPLPLEQSQRFALREGGKIVAAGIITNCLEDSEEDLKEGVEKRVKKKKKTQ